MTMSRSDHVTNQQILDEFWSVFNGLDEDWYDFGAEQLVYNLGLEDDFDGALTRIFDLLDLVINYPEFLKLALVLERASMEDATEPIEGWVYIMLDPQTKLYKIGLSRDPQRRLDEINRNYPPGMGRVTLTRAFYVSNPAAVERMLHDHFSQLNVEREWFALSKDDIQEAERFMMDFLV